MIMDIPNVKYKAFTALIEYLYTDNIKSLKNNQSDDMFETEHLLDLLQLSHEFKIDKLRKLCEEAIEPSITIENSTIILRKTHEIGS